ncbi:replication-relaxation family protein [Promicromonospora thailandica]|uniref:Replication-relaxation n=1 Tax=Promicromonospora thailandica TaxID=765201 RepID=A0A9X2G9W4_9MICO|nr:replication-relaxation family protein [Promicromonospora thailandica]MCP2264621.1 Replication-relaxation [Promicromonospora thailandica]BFF20309.1 replication-relaxation family protein [Promicromonospora thailandica]
MSPQDISALLERLSERDLAVLESLRIHRLLTTAHIRRLHFARGHATLGAASGATMRVLTRLEDHGLVARLMRRIGGVRAGSTGITWQLGATGERLLRRMHGETKRRRYVEPSGAFVKHTLLKAELAIQLHELAETEAIELLNLETEPDCWRSFVGPHGTREWLKPDLSAITATAEYESHWFVEADLSTEHPPEVVNKAKVYQRYAATGAYQDRHGVFPAVLWVVPDDRRKKALEAALSADPAVQTDLFRITTVDRFQEVVAVDTPDPPDHPVPMTQPVTTERRNAYGTTAT